VIQRAFRYRLEPTDEQAELLAQFAGAARFVYNLALEQRRTFWRQYLAETGGNICFASQCREVTLLRAEVEWLRDACCTALHYALRDLDRAFQAFFAGRADYPKPRRKGANDSFRVKGSEVSVSRLNARWSAVKLPKIGWVKFRDTRPMRGRAVNASVCRSADGWHVSFACEIEHEAPANHLPAVGIDRGVANTLALSTGELLSTPDLAHLERRKRSAQRILSRRVRGSKRYRKQRRRLSRIAAKIARCRADWRHGATADIASRFGVVALEALPVQSLVSAGKRKRGLNRSIMEQGWGAFERVLAYKLEERGGSLIKINPAFTSQECSACGVIDKASRESQSRFACRHCGFTDHADTNAAKVILRRSAPRVEGGDNAPVEARTMNLAA
jgi:putative transposase